MFKLFRQADIELRFSPPKFNVECVSKYILILYLKLDASCSGHL